MNFIIVCYRTVIGYAFLFLLMRFMGKREIGQLNLFDLIILLSIADIMVFGIDRYDTNILYSFLPMLIVALIQKIIALISLKVVKFRKFIDGEESIVVIDGKINISEMKKQKYNMDDLYSQLREKDIFAIENVKFAVLEANGKLSVLRNNKSIDASLPIIISGKIIEENLKATGYSKEWLIKTLSKIDRDYTKILGASIIDGKVVEVKEYL